MLSMPLSSRRDLVEGLDADAILDYLTHHRVLDPGTLVALESQDQPEPGRTIQRNAAILREVEGRGDTAVALFINALRQSGQLHLASSLDTEQRIKPMAGEGYLDKPRHKGEIVVRLSVEALKILAPREPPNEKNVNMSLLSSPSKDRSDFIDSDDDQVKPRSCWCFCISRKRRARSSSSNKRKNSKREDQMYYTNQGAIFSPALSSNDPVNSTNSIVTNHSQFLNQNVLSIPEYNNQNTNGSNNISSNVSFTSAPYPSDKTSSISTNPPTVIQQNKTEKVVKKKKDKSKSKEKSSGTNPANFDDSVQFSPSLSYVSPYPSQLDTPDSRGNKTSRSENSKQQKNSKKKTPKHLDLSSNSPRLKENEGIFMEYDPQLELVKLRGCHDELASPTRKAGPVGIMVEQWKSNGKHFLLKSEVLCRSIVNDFLTDIIKYFEQDRGTLVLDVISEARSVTVFNICMTKNQVKNLEKDHLEGSLLETLQEVFMSRLDIAKFDIRGVQFCTEIDGNQLRSVMSEFS